MANRQIQPDEIRWILSLDAKGVQSELHSISSDTQNLQDQNKNLVSDLKETEKWLVRAEKEMQRLEKAGDTTSVTYQRASASFHQLSADAESLRTQIEANNDAIRENNNRHDNIIRTMRIEDMTMTQLRQRARELQIQFDNTAESADPEAYRQLDHELSEVNARIGELNEGSQSMLSIFKGGLMVMVGNLLTQGVDKIKEWIGVAKDWVVEGMNMAKGAEGVVSAYNKLSNSGKIMRDMKNATSDTISELKLMEKTLKADELGIPIENMGKLMEYARIQSVKLKKDVDYMADSIVDGIGKKSTLVLDNLGLSATRVQSEFKKTGDFTQAIMKIVNEELANQGEVALTAADRAAQSTAKWENAQLAVGKKFLWLGELWDSVSSDIADSILDIVGETRTANDAYEDQLNKVARLNAETTPLLIKYEEMSQKIKLNKEQTEALNPEQEELLGIINQITAAVPGAASEWDNHGRVIKLNTQAAWDYIEVQKEILKYTNRDLIAEQTRKAESAAKSVENYRNKLAKEGQQKTYGFGEGSVTEYEKYTLEQRDKLQKELAFWIAEENKANNVVNELNGTSLEKRLEMRQKEVLKQNEFNDMNKKELDIWIKDTKNANSEYLRIAKQTYQQRFGANDGGGPKTPTTDPELTRQKKALNDLNQELDTKYLEDRAKINLAYKNKQIKTESDYNRKLFANEQAYYVLREEKLNKFVTDKTKTEVKDDVSKQLAEIQEKRLAKELDFRKKLEKIILDANPLEKEKQEYKNRLDALNLIDVETGEVKKVLTADEHRALELLEKQHLENIKKIKESGAAQAKKDAETRFNEGTDTEPGFNKRKEELQLELNELMSEAAANTKSFDAEMDVHLKRLQMITEEIEARKAAGVETTKQIQEQGRIEANMTTSINKELQKRTAQFQQYGNTVGQALVGVMTGQETALKAFGDASIDIVFDILSKIIEAELIKVMASSTSAIMRATAESMATPASALSFGTAGFATAAILTGAITAATLVAKTALSGMLGKKKGSSSSSSETSKSSGSITVKQRAQGKYDVIGNDDGRLYKNVPYTGDAQTGIVSRPTLMGERGSELVISHLDFKALQKHINYPVIAEAINDARTGRVPQRASGKYDSLGNYIENQDSGAANLNPEVLQRLTEAIDNLNQKEFNGYLGITEYQAMLNKATDTNKRFTRS